MLNERANRSGSAERLTTSSPGRASGTAAGPSLVGEDASDRREQRAMPRGEYAATETGAENHERSRNMIEIARHIKTYSQEPSRFGSLVQPEAKATFTAWVSEASAVWNWRLGRSGDTRDGCRSKNDEQSHDVP